MAAAIDVSQNNAFHTSKNNLTVTESSIPRSVSTQDACTVQIKDLAINGFVSPTTRVANFLNIPYARIPARFREAKLIDPRRENGILDATKYGPCCPQPEDKTHFTTSHLYPKMINVEHSSEFGCLNLNIYAPPNAVTSNARLPVLVWIHGGGFTYGDGAEEYDGNYIVQHSIVLGKPVVFVAMNYRLGYYGFLSSKELRDEARRNGETGFANLGFHDQRIAFQWIQNNIHFFGGNGFEITACGESAGAYSQLFHLRSNFPAFQRAFILSSVALPPQTAESAQATFDRVVARTTLASTAPPSNKIEALRSLTPKQLEEPLGVERARPTWDEDWFVYQDPGSNLEDPTPFPSWIKGIVIGSAKEESSLFCPEWETMTGAEAQTTIRKAFGNGDVANEVIATYNITSDDKPGSAVDQLIRLSTDGAFGLSRDVAATHTELPVSLYSFEQSDTFPNSPYKGRAYHSLGNSMFFRLPTVAGEAADPNMRKTSNAMCEAAITLAYGEQPWKPFVESKEVMVFDGEKTGLRKVEGPPQWKNLTSTKEKEALFKAGCTRLIVEGMNRMQAKN